MKRAGLIVLGLLSLLNVGVAQLATDPNEGLWIKKDAPGFYTMRWYGHTGRTYFVQQSLDLQTWTYVHDIWKVQDVVIPFALQTDRKSVV